MDMLTQTCCLDEVAFENEDEDRSLNQRGEEVCYFRRKVMVWKAEFFQGRKRPYDGTDIWADAD